MALNTLTSLAHFCQGFAPWGGCKAVVKTSPDFFLGITSLTSHHLIGFTAPQNSIFQSFRFVSLLMCSYGPPHMAKQKQDDQPELTYSSYVRTQDVTLRTCQRRRIIGRSGERGSEISVLVARHDDDNDDISINVFVGMCVCMCACRRVCMYVCTCLYVCVSMYVRS